MTNSVFGEVIKVKKFNNGDLEIDFYHDEQITQYRYSNDPGRLGNFPKDLAETLASTLDTNICIEIFFQDDGFPSYLELEQCEDDEEYEDE
ncbi:hypothetical protein [Nitrosopumilus sp. Nsub]|uniref:hypothetical protein n=1 Tax=Nitrosopumilus sp. Nsub TaxID=1776294 RepID=UPI00082D5AF5|nr:hypothetical protein [Nitrosopumilus sp. Nsub]